MLWQIWEVQIVPRDQKGYARKVHPVNQYERERTSGTHALCGRQSNDHWQENQTSDLPGGVEFMYNEVDFEILILYSWRQMESQYHPKLRFPFSLEKGTAMLQYLLHAVGGEYNYMALLKLAFFADRFHVRKHARPVSMDDYFAFSYGPGGTMLKDILLEPGVIFFERECPIIKTAPYTVALTSSDYQLNQFSKSDIQAMDFSLHFFGETGKQFGGEFVLSDISHAYPEWDRYAELFNAHKTKREEIYYEDFLKNADEKHPMFLKHGFSDPFKKISEEERADLLEEMREYSSNLYL
jgi:hypothetical protein